ncbi:MAG: hypothetical protein KF901_01530 [Myxococcales bacterium]|nr:hypothetical protein [Myxococcales bacterium]
MSSPFRALSLISTLALGCGTCQDDRRSGPDGGDATDAAVDAGSDGALDGAPIGLDAACAVATEEATVSLRPVDILFMVDNSSSMEPAVREVNQGLNDFAARIAASGLDYRVIMLSLRGATVMGSLHPVCIPPPLGGAGCADGARFFHVDVNISSTQLVEQLLGTLGQTEGYLETDARGSAPWRMHLRDDSTKTIVFVTDDNARTCARPVGTCQAGEPPLTETSLEDFPGGPNPFNSAVLGPGIRTATYGSLFEGYTFNAIYGWGSATDPSVRCRYPDGSQPDAPGHTYTALVARTSGVRAQICDQASSAAWDDFFERIASRVEETARLDCTLPLPEPPDGLMLDPTKVNVVLRSGDDARVVGKVRDEAACGTFGGWYYDSDAAPTEVRLCPASCEEAQEVLRREGSAGIDVQFGCDTLLI